VVTALAMMMVITELRPWPFNRDGADRYHNNNPLDSQTLPRLL
jgi:hypothetical protein